MYIIQSRARKTTGHDKFLPKKLVKLSQASSAPEDSLLTPVCWNVRSVNNKVDNIMSFAVDRDIPVLFLIETWLTDGQNSVTATIESYGYNISFTKLGTVINQENHEVQHWSMSKD